MQHCFRKYESNVKSLKLLLITAALLIGSICLQARADMPDCLYTNLEIEDTISETTLNAENILSQDENLATTQKDDTFTNYQEQSFREDYNSHIVNEGNKIENDNIKWACIIIVIAILLIVNIARCLIIFRGTKSKITIYSSIKKDMAGCMFYLLGLICVISLLWMIYQSSADSKLLNIAISIVGTMLGLILTFLLLRPKLILKQAYIYHKISSKNKSIDSPDDGCLSLCIANWGIFPVHDIKVSAFWLREPNNDSKHPNDKDFQNEWKTMRISMFRPKMSVIQGIFSPKNNTYSCHSEESLCKQADAKNNRNQDIQEKTSLTKEQLNNGELYGDIILCRVKATHSLSGLTKVYEWKFTTENILDFNKDKVEQTKKNKQYSSFK